jgi:hypothetical protein
MRTATKAELYDYYAEEERTGRDFIEWERNEEGSDGRLYTVYKNTKNGEMFKVVTVRSVHIGFNSHEPEKVAKLIEIVEREGACEARWGVTGRTAHALLAEELSEKLPQFNCKITYNYGCTFTRK